MILTPQAQAFSPGTELWVCPGYRSTSNSTSKWTASIDWQLNFALSKYDSHQSAEVSLTLQKIIAQTEFPLESHKQSSEFVLVSSEIHLPVKWVLFFEPTTEPQKEFFNRLEIKAKELNIQTLRVFLPSNWSLEAIQKYNLPNHFHMVTS